MVTMVTSLIMKLKVRMYLIVCIVQGSDAPISDFTNTPINRYNLYNTDTNYYNYIYLLVYK